MNYHFQLIIEDKNDATEYVLTFFNITKADYLSTCAISAYSSSLLLYNANTNTS